MIKKEVYLTEDDYEIITANKNRKAACHIRLLGPAIYPHLYRKATIYIEEEPMVKEAIQLYSDNMIQETYAGKKICYKSSGNNPGTYENHKRNLLNLNECDRSTIVLWLEACHTGIAPETSR